MIDRLTWSAPPSLADGVREALARWDRDGNTRRLWGRDATLWTGADEARWLGWLEGATAGRAALPDLEALATDVREAGFTHALLLGMGGSSLCPEVLARTFGRQAGAPELHVLDSTDPAQVLSLEGRVDLDRTIVIVASKSGTTLEPNVFMRYFFERIASAHDRARAGRQFIAITDPGSQLQQVAQADRFRHIVHGEPTIGGRYSALSPFGLVPAAVMGLDVDRFLTVTTRMVEACGADVPAGDNPGVQLGVLLGVCATHGRDKLTIVTSPGLVALGAWLEQLVAESTGKAGRAIIPVDLETPGAPGVYGTDRVFVYLRLADRPDAAQDQAFAALEAAGHVVARIDVSSADAIGQEFFRWEVATAVAGAIMGINPFDQPDVEASKVATRALTAAYERDGRLPAEAPLAAEDGLALFTDPVNAAALRAAGTGVDDILRAHLARLQPDDYFAVLAYVEMNARHTGVLQRLRHHVRDRARVATCLGFGPRFLHSTGQAYKGGPDSGVFLQITCDDARDVPVPGQRYTFGVVKAAQARGDFDVLAERGRRALRVHVGADVASGLEALARRVETVLLR